MDYDLYHDESLEAGYWHGILLIPRDSRNDLLSMLGATRQNLHYFEPINFKGLKKTSGKKYRAIESWIHIGVISIAQRLKGDPLVYTTGKIIFNNIGRRDIEYQRLQKIIGAKFILFRVRDGHSLMNSDLFRDYAAKVETTLRMGLKGGMHLLGGYDSTIRICSFHFDGHEHYGRHIDIRRIVNRIRDLRGYCSFDESLLVDDRSSDHRRTEICQAYDDCQFLQLTDILVGAFRTILATSNNPIQVKVSYPISQLIDRWRQGAARMRNSRWYRGFCVSQCYLQDERWQFEDIRSPQTDGEHPDLFTQQHESS
jgi:hypothetical protein